VHIPAQSRETSPPTRMDSPADPLYPHPSVKNKQPGLRLVNLRQETNSQLSAQTATRHHYKHRTSSTPRLSSKGHSTASMLLMTRTTLRLTQIGQMELNYPPIAPSTGPETIPLLSKTMDEPRSSHGAQIRFREALYQHQQSHANKIYQMMLEGFKAHNVCPSKDEPLTWLNTGCL
jgi:hypothetical protein